MRPDIALSGIGGNLIGLLIFATASWIGGNLPYFVQEALAVRIIFAILFVVALAEMPAMVIAMRQMHASASTPRIVLVGTNMAYTAFASVYAAIFTLATRDNSGGLMLMALGPVRWLCGIWIK